MAQLIDGKAVSAAVKAEVAEEAAKLKDEKGLKVGLAVVIVGNDPASVASAIDSMRQVTKPTKEVAEAVKKANEPLEP